MKVLHIKINAIVSDDAKNKIKENVKKDLSEGLLITDDTLTVEFLDFDDNEVRVFSDEDPIGMTYDEMKVNYDRAIEKASD